MPCLGEKYALLNYIGPPVVPFYRFFFGWEGSPTKVDYRKKGTLIKTSLLEDLVKGARYVR